MSDFYRNTIDYQFEEEQNMEELKDLAVNAGLKFEQTIAGAEYLNGNFHENQNTQTTGQHKPYSRTRFEVSRRPNILSDNYDGELDARGVAEYIVEDLETVKYSLESAIPNRQDRAAEEMHITIEQTGNYSLIDEAKKLDAKGEIT